MSEFVKLLVFVLSGVQCALSLSVVQRVLRAVEISPVPNAPDIVMGLLNMQGIVIPVLNIRRRFRLPESALRVHDHIVVARTDSRPVALPVDAVIGVAEYAHEEITPPDEVFPGIGYLEGVAKLNDGILYIYSLESFLSPEEKAGIEPLLSPETSLPVEETR